MANETVVDAEINIPTEWVEISVSTLRGTLMVVGGSDTGKSTFASYIYRRLASQSVKAAYLDGDPGQGRLGPPGTMTLGNPGEDLDPERIPSWRVFVGSSTPSRHMLPVLVGASKLVQKAYCAGANALVYDTTGLIDPFKGGLSLKLAKINLIRPSVLFAIQRKTELENLLRPLRQSGRVRVVDLEPCPAVRIREREARADYRSIQMSRYFRPARTVRVDWSGLAVFPAPEFTLHRLLALEDGDAFTLGLGIVTELSEKRKEIALLTPLDSMNGVNALSLGDLIVDPETFRDSPL
jgi:polynucleotide 5'-hydroxyl-kinase GRC3/NOL9